MVATCVTYERHIPRYSHQITLYLNEQALLGRVKLIFHVLDKFFVQVIIGNLFFYDKWFIAYGIFCNIHISYAANRLHKWCHFYCIWLQLALHTYVELNILGSSHDILCHLIIELMYCVADKKRDQGKQGQDYLKGYHCFSFTNIYPLQSSINPNYYWWKKWYLLLSLFWWFIWLFQLIMKVVDIINDSQDDVRPKVLVSASAIGYYGLCLSQFSTQYSLLSNYWTMCIHQFFCLFNMPLSFNAFLGKDHSWVQLEILKI